MGATRRYKTLKHAAAKSRLPLEIDIYEYQDLIEDGTCNYCGGPLSPTGHGLDKMDPYKGYTLDNVVPCCYTCNMIKGRHFNYNQMLILIDFIKKMRQNGWKQPK